MQEAALGNEGTGADERAGGLHPILTDAKLSDNASVQREEVREVAAPAAVGTLAPRRIGEVAKAGLVHRLMHAVQLGSYCPPQLPSRRWRPVQVLGGGLHDPALIIPQGNEHQ